MGGDLEGALKSVMGPQFEIKADSLLGKLGDKLKVFTQGLGVVLMGFGAGIAAGNLLGSFIDTQGDKQTQARMQKANLIGAGAGAAIGAASFGPIGALAGGFFGGILGTLIGGFSSKKVKTELFSSGIAFFNNATSKEIHAKFFKDMKETTTRTSWWGLVKKTSTRYWSEYARVGSYASDQIRKSLSTYEDLIEYLTGARKILSIKAGRYSSTSQALAQNIDAIIASAMKAPLEIEERVVDHLTSTYSGSEWYETIAGKAVYKYLEDLMRAREGVEDHAARKIIDNYTKSREVHKSKSLRGGIK
ncbi:hypothetical protein ACFOPX_04735 [Helicobacter baculiformis]|uniref:Glycine zipper domain-containing protein n=1 Tax=Helicobacter baculiformis TaxID=427351 RepID=A0ABV7ZH26_9HELI|nr:hypothetical protein [Helicobacter baculiformis]